MSILILSDGFPKFARVNLGLSIPREHYLFKFTQITGARTINRAITLLRWYLLSETQRHAYDRNADNSVTLPYTVAK